MKKRVLVMLLTVAMGISLLAGCGKGVKTETGAEVESEESEASVAAQVNDESAFANTEEPSKFNTLDEWIASLDISKPQILVWNEDTKEGIILSNGDSHELIENEKLLYSYLGEWEAFNCKDEKRTIKKMYDGKNYTEFVLELNGTADYQINATFSGTEYEHQFSITANNLVTTEEENQIFTNGADWAKNLGESTTEPKIVIWNDETGTQEILDDGAEYQLCKGDVLAILKPEGVKIKIARPLNIAKTKKGIDFYYSFDCSSVVEKTEFSTDCEINGTEVTLKCILLPPTE